MNIDFNKNDKGDLKMKNFKIEKEIKKEMSEKIREYLYQEFDLDCGGLQSELFLDFIADEIGHVFYNEGLKDSYSFMEDKIQELFILEKRSKM